MYDCNVSLCRNATIWVNVTVTLDSRLQHAANLATVEVFTAVPSNLTNVLTSVAPSLIRSCCCKLCIMSSCFFRSRSSVVRWSRRLLRRHRPARRRLRLHRRSTPTGNQEGLREWRRKRSIPVSTVFLFVYIRSRTVCSLTTSSEYYLYFSSSKECFN